MPIKLGEGRSIKFPNFKLDKKYIFLGHLIEQVKSLKLPVATCQEIVYKFAIGKIRLFDNHVS